MSQEIKEVQVAITNITLDVVTASPNDRDRSGSISSSPDQSSDMGEEDGELTSMALQAAHIAGFRPPSPVNVIHLIERSEIHDEIIQFQEQLRQQGDEMWPDNSVGSPTPVSGAGVSVDSIDMCADVADIAPGIADLRGPVIVPALVSFLHHFNPTESIAESKESSSEPSKSNSSSNSREVESSPNPHSRRLNSIGGNVGSAIKVGTNATAAAAEPSMMSPLEVSVSSPLAISRDVSMEPVPRAHSLAPSPSFIEPPKRVHSLGPSGASFIEPNVPANFTLAQNNGLLMLTQPENALLLNHLLREYVDMAFENPRAFAPFYKHRSEKKDLTQHEKAKMVYHHLKGRESKASIDKKAEVLMKALKPKLIEHFESQLNARQLATAQQAQALINLNSPCAQVLGIRQTAKEEYLQQVNQVIQRLRKKFLEVRSKIDARIASEVIGKYDRIPSFESMNRRIMHLLFEPEILKAVQQYHTDYQRATVNFPGRILLSNLFRNRVESRTMLDEITFNDLIVAVEESTAMLRKGIHGFFITHPEIVRQYANQKPMTHAQAELSKRTADEEQTVSKLYKIYKRAFLGFVHASRIYPKLITPATYGLIRRMRVSDVPAFRLIAESRFQEALWRLHDIGSHEAAFRVEDWINKRVFNDAYIAGVSNLGGGFTTTQLMTMQPDDAEIPNVTSHSGTINGVYKPRPNPSLFNLQSMKDSLVSNHKKEVAAYRIDRLLQLYHVPLTKSMLYQEREGSIQYFVSSAVAARAVQDLGSISSPHAAGKFSDPKGRAFLPRRIRLFDFLIDNRDRNLDNYLISSIDQRVILIDHGWTFNTPAAVLQVDKYHNNKFLRSIIPARKMFQRCQFLVANVALIDEELKFLLSKGNLDSFKYRLQLFVKFVEGEIAKEGMEAVFAIPDAEDSNGLCADA